MNDNERRLCISFSGGETSALMAKLILEKMSGEYDCIVTIFANTGQENEETLEFVNRCDEAFGLGVVWVEAEVNPEHGKGVRSRTVSFETASRDGRPFEDVIRKHGIPNKMWPHCTRELKARPIRSWLRDNSWLPGTYDLSIGIRRDELDRMSPNATSERIIYPLISRFPSSKADVNAFWEKHPFRLELKGYQGNCKWCWKKSLRKHLTIITETPEAYEFPERMEHQYPLAGNNPNGEPRVFFRENRSVADLRRLAATTKFTPATDDARQYQTEFEFGMDASDGCSESCEVDFGEAV